MSYAGETIEVRVDGTQVLFRTTTFGTKFSDISGLNLKKSGVIKEFPDLKDNEDWKKIARDRFKEKIKKMETEKERIEYIISDLSKHGYKALYLQKKGYRPIKLK